MKLQGKNVRSKLIESFELMSFVHAYNSFCNPRLCIYIFEVLNANNTFISNVYSFFIQQITNYTQETRKF